MASHRQTPPLLIRPRVSVRLAVFVTLTHTTAFAAVLALPGTWRLLAVLVALSLAYQVYVHVLRRAPWSVRTLIWQGDGSWIIQLVSGREIEARLSPSTFVSVPLVILNLRHGPLRRWSLPLFADALDPDQLRRLRQRLRIVGVGGKDENAAPA
ncbi:MAG: protein YgfX [Chromatiaceae bacterium]